MKHKTILLIVTIACLFAMLVPGAASAKTKLTFMTCCSQIDRDTVFKQWISDYQKIHPDTEVAFVTVATGYKTKLSVQMAAGAAPDVFWIGMDFWAFTDQLMPLDDIAAKDNALKQIHPSLLQQVRWGGKLLAIPYGMNTHTIFYNSSMFQQAGVVLPEDSWTWDNAIAMSKKLTRDKNGDGSTDQWGINMYLIREALGYGGNGYSEDGRTTLINRPATMKALELFADLYTGKLGVQPPISVKPDQLNQLLTGMTAMGNRGVFDIPKFRDQKNFEWDVAEYPTLSVDGKRYRATFHSPENFAIYAQTKQPEAAKDFLRFIMQREQQVALARLGAIIPTQSSLFETFISLKPPKNIKAFITSFDWITSMYYQHPFFAGSVNNIMFGPLWSQLLAGTLPASTYVQESAQQINKALADAYAK